MKHLCKTCDWRDARDGEVIVFDTGGDKNKINVPIFECHKNAPGHNGFPSTRKDTGCGEHSAYKWKSEEFIDWRGAAGKFETEDAEVFGGSAGGGKTVSMGEEMKERWRNQFISGSEYFYNGIAYSIGQRVRMGSTTGEITGASRRFAPIVLIDEECRNPDAPSPRIEMIDVSEMEILPVETKPHGFGHCPAGTTACTCNIERPRIHDPDAFEVGDMVRVTGKAESYEGGWGNGWNLDMTDSIGEEFTILDAVKLDNYSKHWGYCLDTEDTLGCVQNFFFPSFVLEKVDPKPEGPPNEEYSP